MALKPDPSPFRVTPVTAAWSVLDGAYEGVITGVLQTPRFALQQQQRERAAAQVTASRAAGESNGFEKDDIGLGVKTKRSIKSAAITPKKD